MKVCVRGSFFCYKIPWLFYLPFIVGIGDLGIFRELKDLARYGTFSRCTSTRSSGFRECDSFLDKSQSLNCVCVMLMFVFVEQCLCR
ncbi:hypothetical protein HanXRQr2_Chr16g0766441 [Helianthus annuus]|uniref:Uncharacterized protein n=1 Tax=Helianthus annuus TaxID=4232 RepID=A0A9K3DW07_HELAN|nr:hypothetical protein HanXRQr2_Chr16g0766441 [Helianthus annuus]